MNKFWKIMIVSACVFALAGTVLGLAAVIQTDRNKMLTCKDLGLTELLNSDNITEAAFYFDIPETVAFSDEDLIAEIPEIFNGLTLAKRPKTECDGFLSLVIKTKTKTYAFVLYGNVLDYEGRYYTVNKNLNAAFQKIIDAAIERHGTAPVSVGCFA